MVAKGVSSQATKAAWSLPVSAITDGGLLDDGSRFCDDEPEAPTMEEECKPGTSGVLTFASLVPAGYLPAADERLPERGLDVQSRGDDRGIDLDCSVIKFGGRHDNSTLRPLDSAGLSAAFSCRTIKLLARPNSGSRLCQ